MAQNAQTSAAPDAANPPAKVETYEVSPPSANPPESYSGEALVVAAYALVWIAVFVFVAMAWRRTRGLEGRLDRIESALEKSRAAPVPSTKRSAAED